jgi:hypothetical protein
VLALWEYFWDWDGAPTPTPTPTPSPGGGGGHKGHGHQKNVAYLPLPDEYWEERAKRLTPAPKPGELTLADKQAQLEADIRQILLEQQQLAQMKQTHDTALQSLRTATSPEEMKTISDHIDQLNEEGKTLTSRYNARVVRAKSLRFELLH